MSQSASEKAAERIGTNQLIESDRHHLLSAERRRTVLAILAERSEPISLGTLAEQVLGREAEGDGEPALDEVTISLHHVHLPAMDDLGLIEYDHSEKRIE